MTVRGKQAPVTSYADWHQLMQDGAAGLTAAVRAALDEPGNHDVDAVVDEYRQAIDAVLSPHQARLGDEQTIVGPRPGRPWFLGQIPRIRAHVDSIDLAAIAARHRLRSA